MSRVMNAKFRPSRCAVRQNSVVRPLPLFGLAGQIYADDSSGRVSERLEKGISCFPYSLSLSPVINNTLAYIICGHRRAFPSCVDNFFVSSLVTRSFFFEEKLSEGHVDTRQFGKRRRRERRRGGKNNWYLMRRLVDQRRLGTLDRSRRVGHHL